MDHQYILAMKVNSISPAQAVSQINDWAQKGQSRYVCIANVHMAMESYDDSKFREVVNSADMITPDGMPLVWMLRALGKSRQQRVCGPDLTIWLCKEASENKIPIGFYGGSPETLEKLSANLKKWFPNMQIACLISPPFRKISEEEDAAFRDQIVSSGAKILFVGLGCPKQEKWMAEHKGKIPAVMIGVGAAFDFHAGKVKQAPKWMQKMGMEWLFRFFMEPTRLWRRYLKHNPRFVVFAVKQLTIDKLKGGSR